SGMKGHIITGYTDYYSNFLGNDMILTRTDVNGNISGTSAFNNVYRLSLGQQKLDPHPVEVIHTPNNRILVAGTAFHQNGNAQIFITAASAGGGFFMSTGYFSSSYNRIHATSACLSIYNSAHIYVTGYAEQSPNGRIPIVMCVDWTSNTLVWSQVYDLRPSIMDWNTPSAIICSPNANELVIVGNCVNGAQNDVFLIKADASSGILKPLALSTGTADVAYYDSRGGIEVATGITTGSSTSGGSQGFVICGNSNFGLSGWPNEALLFKVDDNGNALWTNWLRFGNGATEINDVVERLNTSNQYEYYVTGTAKNGYNTGTSDILVFKCDDNGSAVAEFTIDDALSQEGICAGLVENTADDGLAIYGRENSAQYSGFGGDMRMVKTYFNGVLGCNEIISSFVENHMYMTANGASYGTAGSLSSNSYSVNLLGPIAEFPICSASSVAGGSNAREASSNLSVQSATSLSLFPNPSAAGANTIQLTTSYEKSELLKIELYSADGRLIETFSKSVTEGNNMFTLNLQQELVSGAYLIRVQDSEKTEMLRLIVQ
ncbi:MAG: T9SS type A sorting domain-containing protein, partial [Bacteroidia bacterium]